METKRTSPLIKEQSSSLLTPVSTVTNTKVVPIKPYNPPKPAFVLKPEQVSKTGQFTIETHINKKRVIESQACDRDQKKRKISSGIVKNMFNDFKLTKQKKKTAIEKPIKTKNIKQNDSVKKTLSLDPSPDAVTFSKRYGVSVDVVSYAENLIFWHKDRPHRIWKYIRSKKEILTLKSYDTFDFKTIKTNKDPIVENLMRLSNYNLDIDLTGLSTHFFYALTQNPAFSASSRYSQVSMLISNINTIKFDLELYTFVYNIIDKLCVDLKLPPYIKPFQGKIDVDYQSLYLAVESSQVVKTYDRGILRVFLYIIRFLSSAQIVECDDSELAEYHKKIISPPDSIDIIYDIAIAPRIEKGDSPKNHSAYRRKLSKTSTSNQATEFNKASFVYQEASLNAVNELQMLNKIFTTPRKPKLISGLNRINEREHSNIISTLTHASVVSRVIPIEYNQTKKTKTDLKRLIERKLNRDATYLANNGIPYAVLYSLNNTHHIIGNDPSFVKKMSIILDQYGKEVCLREGCDNWVDKTHIFCSKCGLKQK